MLWFACHGQEKLELRGQLVLGVETVREVNSSNSAVGVDLNSEGLDVVGAVSSTREVGKVELNLVPALVQPHGHGADEWLHSCRTLVVGSSESSAHILVVQDLNLESEVFFQLF